MHTENRNSPLLAPVFSTIQHLLNEVDLIPEARKAILQKLALFVQDKRKKKEKPELNFICTHNSRRSHLAQIWAQTAAAYYGVENVACYSGGTEATAFNPRAVKAMEEAGFQIKKIKESPNPVYEVRFSMDAPSLLAFSKKYDAPGNPKKAFAAVMTCSQADQNCPLVAGAEARFSIPYDDPKDFDGTPREGSVYRERVQQIGREMLYVFSLINP
jgi:arsenate reductase